MTTFLFWIIFAALVASVVLLVVIAFVWAWFIGRKQKQRPGFEVKLNTGEEPVIEKKENDHG